MIKKIRSKKYYLLILTSALLFFSLITIFIKAYRKEVDTSICSDCNVIIVAYDALQAAHVSHLGYSRKTTPMMDQIAGEGFVFSNAVTAAPWTIPSYMSMFTGLYPTEHKLVNKWFAYSDREKVPSSLTNISPQVQTLAQVLKEKGYATAGFTGDSGVSAAFGYDLGFDIYRDKRQFGGIDTYSKEVLDWVAQNKDKSFFLFLHGYDAHGQFHTVEDYQGRFENPEYDGRFKGSWQEQAQIRDDLLYNRKQIDFRPEDIEFWRSWYDSKIRDGDDRFASFWNEFNKLNLKNKTIVIMVSDHGTEFYEHKKFDHGFSLYEELVHVPLVFKIPGMEGGKVINQQVTTIDIAPTLIDVLGIDPGQQYMSQLRGHSLLPLLEGKNVQVNDVFMETDFLRFTYKRGVRTADGWKLIKTMENGEEELYDLKTDPRETNNLAAINPNKVNELRQKLYKHMEGMGVKVDGPWPLGCFPAYLDQCK